MWHQFPLSLSTCWLPDQLPLQKPRLPWEVSLQAPEHNWIQPWAYSIRLKHTTNTQNRFWGTTTNKILILFPLTLPFLQHSSGQVSLGWAVDYKQEFNLIFSIQQNGPIEPKQWVEEKVTPFEHTTQKLPHTGRARWEKVQKPMNKYSQKH